MGKQQRIRNKKRNRQNYVPFVSVCTPTFNRRPFFYSIIECFKHQTYPKDRMEWIIIDDGTDKIKDLVCDIPEVKYFEYNHKLRLGEKRNIMHEKSKGSILVYMDDDDYYPPERVSHAVEMLTNNKHALCAGSSEIYIYYNDLKKMMQFGPYGPNHATAGTFAFKRRLLNETKYEDTASLAEEKKFLKDYTIPFVQLDPIKTILVFSHDHNTFNKKQFLNSSKNTKFVKESNKTVDMFIKEEHLKEFFTNKMDKLLSNYEAGKPEMKPDVLQQIKEITEKREREQQQQISQTQNNIHNKNIVVKDDSGNSTVYSIHDLFNIIQQQKNEINLLKQQVNNITKI